MKKITIFQKESPPIILIDDDDSEIQEYTQELSNIMKMSNIAYLQIKDECVIIKPSNIISIKVSNYIEQNTNQIQEDCITDI